MAHPARLNAEGPNHSAHPHRLGNFSGVCTMTVDEEWTRLWGVIQPQLEGIRGTGRVDSRVDSRISPSGRTLRPRAAPQQQKAGGSGRAAGGGAEIPVPFVIEARAEEEAARRKATGSSRGSQEPGPAVGANQKAGNQPSPSVRASQKTDNQPGPAVGANQKAGN